MDPSSANPLTGWDWFVVLVVLASLGVGFWRGFVRTVFALAAWIAALVLTPIAGPVAVGALGMQQHPWVVLVGVFIVVLLTVRLVGWGLARLIGRLGLGGVDRLFGAALGVARGLLVVLLAAAAAHALELDRRTAWKESISRPLLDALVGFAQPYLPQRAPGVRET